MDLVLTVRRQSLYHLLHHRSITQHGRRPLRRRATFVDIFAGELVFDIIVAVFLLAEIPHKLVSLLKNGPAIAVLKVGRGCDGLLKRRVPAHERFAGRFKLVVGAYHIVEAVVQRYERSVQSLLGRREFLGLCCLLFSGSRAGVYHILRLEINVIIGIVGRGVRHLTYVRAQLIAVGRRIALQQGAERHGVVVLARVELEFADDKVAVAVGIGVAVIGVYSQAFPLEVLVALAARNGVFERVGGAVGREVAGLLAHRVERYPAGVGVIGYQDGYLGGLAASAVAVAHGEGEDKALRQSVGIRDAEIMILLDGARLNCLS